MSVSLSYISGYGFGYSKRFGELKQFDLILLLTTYCLYLAATLISHNSISFTSLPAIHIIDVNN